MILYQVVHVEGDVNPVRDLEIIQNELRLKDVEHLTKRLADLEKVYTRGGEKKVNDYSKRDSRAELGEIFLFLGVWKIFCCLSYRLICVQTHWSCHYCWYNAFFLHAVLRNRK